MKKLAGIVFVIILSVTVVVANADITTDFSLPDKFPSFDMQLPEFDPIDTSDWGNFSITLPSKLPEMPEFDMNNFGLSSGMPEGWGDLNIESFTLPTQDAGWGDLGMNDNWGASFEEMKKKAEEQFSGGTNNTASNWPPESFKDLENAFSQAKADSGESKSGMEDIQSLFSSKFGNMNTGTSDAMEMPNIDSAQGLLDMPTLQDPNNGFIGAVTNVVNLEKIGAFLGNTEMTELDTNMEPLPSLGSVNRVGLNSYYSELSGKLKPRMDVTQRYNGSLFGAAQ